jgi:hypothetical protein
MKVQTVTEYLASGGRIKRYRSRADEIAASVIPTGKYCQRDAYIQKLIEIKQQNYLKKAHIANAPVGGIEPRRPDQSRPNPKKTGLISPVVIRRRHNDVGNCQA